MLRNLREVYWHSADLDAVTAAAAVVLVTEAVAVGVAAAAGGAAAVVLATDAVCLKDVCAMACHMCSTFAGSSRQPTPALVMQGLASWSPRTGRAVCRRSVMRCA